MVEKSHLVLTAIRVGSNTAVKDVLFISLPFPRALDLQSTFREIQNIAQGEYTLILKQINCKLKRLDGHVYVYHFFSRFILHTVLQNFPAKNHPELLDRDMLVCLTPSALDLYCSSALRCLASVMYLASTRGKFTTSHAWVWYFAEIINFAWHRQCERIKFVKSFEGLSNIFRFVVENSETSAGCGDQFRLKFWETKSWKINK